MSRTSRALVSLAASITFAAIALLGTASSADAVIVPLTQSTTYPTTLTIGFTPGPIYVGQPLTVTVTATSTGGGTPTGSVTLTQTGGIGVTTPIALDGTGVATFMPDTTYSGTYTFNATYAGDANHAAATAGPASVNVIKYPTTITLTPSLNPIHVGQTGTLTVTVSSAGGTPTGNVTVGHTGSIAINGTPWPLTNGVLTVDLDSAYADTTVYTATYAGDASHEAVTSAPLTVPVIKWPTTLTMSVNTPLLHVGDTGGAVNMQVSSIGGGTPTGTIAFTQTGGIAVSPTLALLSGATSFGIDTTYADTLVFTAAYSGDPSHAASSAPIAFAVVSPAAAAPTTTVLSSSADPSVAGASVTFTAQVSAFTGQPTGNVTFYDETGTARSTAALASGSATYTTSALTAGLHTITAVYEGSGATWARSFGALVQGVNTPNTTLSSSANPSFVGDTVNIRVQIPSVNGQPATGSVFFSLDTLVGTSFGQSIPLDSAGGVTVPQTLTAAGVYTYSAAYSGNGPTRTDSLIQIVNRYPTTLTLTPSVNPIHVGETGTLTVTANTTGGGTPTGNVTVGHTGSIAINGTPWPLTNGVLTVDLDSAYADTTVYTATYAGDASHAPATAQITIPVIKYPTTITVTVSPTSLHTGEALTVTIHATSSGGGVPGGSISLVQTGGVAINAPFALDSAGTVVFSPVTTYPGTYTFTAGYAGDASHDAATSVTSSATVAPPATTTVVTSSLAPSKFGDPVTFSATVTGSGGTPTGTVQFTVDGVAVGGPVALSSGKASFTSSGLAVGAHTIAASYGGSASFDVSSGSLQQLVNKADQTIQLASLGGKTYGDVDFAVSATATSGLTVTFAATGQCTLTSGTIHITAAGSCSVTASQAGNASYNAAPSVTRSFAIATAPLTITANDKTRRYQSPDPAFDAAYSGFVNGEGVSALTGTLACTSTATMSSTVGTYPITCSGQTATNYAITYVAGTLTITKAATTTHISDISVSYGTTSVAVSATVTAQSPSSATVAEGTVTIAVRSGATVIASATAPANAGSASTTLTLPAGTFIGAYDLVATYAGGTDFESSSAAATLNVTCPTTVRFPMPNFGNDESEGILGVVEGRTSPNGPSCSVSYDLTKRGQVVGHGTFIAGFTAPNVITISLGTIVMDDDGLPYTFSGTVTRAGSNGTVALTFTNTRSGKSRNVTLRLTETATGSFIVASPPPRDDAKKTGRN